MGDTTTDVLVRAGSAGLLCAASLLGQTARKPDPGVRIWTIRQANFTRAYEKAVSGAQSLLKEEAFADNSYRSLRCDALLHLYFAHSRLKQEKAAAAAYASFVDASAKLPRDHALLHQMVDIREAFGLNVDALKVEPRPRHQPAPDPTWPAVSAKEPKPNPRVLTELAAASRRAGGDGLLVALDGRIAFEEYGPGYREPMFTMSSVKSMTGLLTGLAIADGKLPSVKARVGEFLPEWKDGRRGAVTVEHLLTMTSGLLRLRTGGVPSAADKNAFVRKLQPAVDPGSRWSYSNEGVQLLGAVLEEALGEPLPEYARRRLFSPLGMRATGLRTDRAGHAIAYADARTTLRDFARLGVVVSRGGVFEGRQVLPVDWLRRSVAPIPANTGYGYLWWVYGEDCFAMEGYLGTSVWIWPKKKIVVARVQARPSLLADGPLDEKAFRALMARL